MINFFRKTRKKLADQNKFFTYARYAIGEIVLVVIGILIALQINNWNERRKDRSIEKITLDNLKTDLKSALKQLNTKINQNRTFFVHDSILLDVIHNEKALPKDSIEYLILSHVFTPIFDPELGSMNEIISTGKLNLIENNLIRYHISSWNKYMDELNGTNETLIHLDLNVKHTIFANQIPFKNIYSSVHKGFKGLAFPKSNFDWSPEKTLYNLEFENMLANYIFYLSIQKSRHTDLKRKINEMLILIDEELESND